MQIIITPADLYCTVKVEIKCISVSLFSYACRTPLQVKPADCISGCTRCGHLVGPLWSPLPHAGLSNACCKLSSPERICILFADWPGEGTLPQASSTNGDSAAWVIGRGQVASLHFSFFSFNQQPSHCPPPTPILSSFGLSQRENGVGLANPRL